MNPTSFNLDEETKEYICSQSIKQKGRGAMRNGLFQILADHQNFQDEILQLKKENEEQVKELVALSYFKRKIVSLAQREALKAFGNKMDEEEKRLWESL